MRNINMPVSGDKDGDELPKTTDEAAEAVAMPDSQTERAGQPNTARQEGVNQTPGGEGLKAKGPSKEERMKQIEANLEGGEYPEPTNTLAQVLDRSSRVVISAEPVVVQKIDGKYYIGKDEDHLKFNIGFGIKPAMGQVFFRTTESKLAMTEGALDECNTRYEKYRANLADQSQGGKKGWVSSLVGGLFRRGEKN